MTKFTVTNEAPRDLTKGEMVIVAPNFLEQIKANSRKAPKHMQTATHHLREILNSIAEKYDHDMNPLSVKLVNYVGLAFKNNDDLCNIVTRILKAEYPSIFDKALAFEIRNRPMNTKLIHYVGDFSSTKAFYEAGLDLIDQKDVEGFLSDRPKKVVGKPALKKEEPKDSADGS